MLGGGEGSHSLGIGIGTQPYWGRKKKLGDKNVFFEYETLVVPRRATYIEGLFFFFF